MDFKSKICLFQKWLLKTNLRDYFANIFITLSLANLLFLVFSKLYFGRDLFIHFLWFPDDFPGIGLKDPPRGLGAGHFFGDFLHTVTVATTGLGVVPYFPYLPASALLVLPFSFLPYLFSFFLFYVLFTGIVLGVYFKVLDKFNLVHKFQFGVIFGLLNVGNIYSFDRGNVQIAITALIVLGVYFASKEQYLKFALCISLAGAIKVWPFFFLLYLVRRKKFYEIFVSISVSVVVNIVTILIYNFDLRFVFSHLIGQWNLIQQFNSVGSSMNHTGAKSSSLLVTFSILSERGPDWLHAISKIALANFQALQALILVLLVVLYFSVKMKNLAIEYTFLASVVLVVPAGQYGYALGILPIAIFLILASYDDFKHKMNFSGLFGIFFSLNLLLVLLIPWTIPISGNTKDSRYPWDLNSLINPIFLVTLICLCLILMRSKENGSICCARE
jgi:hypothetical protein